MGTRTRMANKLWNTHPKKFGPGSRMPCLQQQAWIDPQVWLGHVPPMLPGVRRGRWFPKVPLIAGRHCVLAWEARAWAEYHSCALRKGTDLPWVVGCDCE